MRKKIIITSIVLILGIGTAVICSYAFGDGHGGHEGHGEDSEITKLMLLDRMGTALHDITATLEGKDSQKILSISFEDKDGLKEFFKDQQKYVLTAFVVEDGTIYEVELDPATGSEQSRRKAGFWSVWDEDWKNLPTDDFKVSTAEIIRKVEESLQSSVLEIELDREDGIYVYQLETASPTGSRSVLVDPYTGIIYPYSDVSRYERHDR